MIFKKLNEKATLPERATSGSAGFDLVATDRIWSDNDEMITYHTGITIDQLPEGHVALLFARSSISQKDLRLANGVGVIDADYRGEILVKFDVPKVSAQVVSKGNTNVYGIGDKIAQIVIVPCFLGEQVKEERTGGFGSTGNTPRKGKNGRKDDGEGS